MTRTEYEVTGKQRAGNQDTDNYTIMMAALDSHPGMYEHVFNIEENCGFFATYRDIEQRCAVALEAEHSDSPLILALVGDEVNMERTLERIKEVAPKVLEFKKIEVRE